MTILQDRRGGDYQGLNEIMVVASAAQRTRTTMRRNGTRRRIPTLNSGLRQGNRAEETRLGVDNRRGLGNDRVSRSNRRTFPA